MREETIQKIKNNKMIREYLKNNSYHYKELYRDDNYLKKVESLAKECYHERGIDKIEKMKNKLDLINTIMSVMN